MNSISLVSVAELLDGRHFFIPAYQRGYRWSEAQMLELLDDLYEFAIREKKSSPNSAGEFYCLQPIIVQRVTDSSKLSAIKNITAWGDEVSSENTWEVIDGQQRLTSIYILYRFLIGRNKISEQELKDDYNMELYRLCYETRPDTKKYLEGLSASSLSEENIDYAFITNAFKAIDIWLADRAPNLAKRYSKRSNAGDILNTLCELLRTRKEDVGESTGSAQFIWYELAPDSHRNPIDEFVNINNGKIRLTDAELIKGLILQKRNFVGNKEAEQMKIALQWEDIENTLHRNDFWNFLSDKTDEDNRIELLFSLRYYQERSEAPKDGDLFRFYINDLLSKQPGQELEDAVKKEWKNIMSMYLTLQEWYEDPVLYNTIGFLIHSGVKISKIIEKHSAISPTASKQEFFNELKKLIEEKLPTRVEVKAEDIECNYKSSKTRVKSLLLFINIYQLNKQIMTLRESDATFMTPAYKFPFDLYVSQEWDVEHIDSATKNDLREVDEQEEWLHQSLYALDLPLTDELNQWFGHKDFVKIWEYVLSKSPNSTSDDEEKDRIGNLTLLDAKTNCGYKNSIFAFKRFKVNVAMNEGRFIPICTQMVFNKSFSKKNVNLREWNDDDKKNYEQFIVKQLREFYNMDSVEAEQNLFTGNE